MVAYIKLKISRNQLGLKIKREKRVLYGEDNKF